MNLNRRKFIFGSAACALASCVKCDGDDVGALTGADTAKIRDIIKCRNDIVYFAEKYVKRPAFSTGSANVTLKDWQKEYLTHLATGESAVLCAYRQSRKTTTNVIYAIWKTVFNSNQRVTFVTVNRHMSDEIFAIAEAMFELLPEWMKARDRKNEYYMRNAKHIVMKNGSELLTTFAGADFRGYDPGNTLILDEYALFTAEHVENIRDLYIVTSAHKNHQLLMASTPLKQNSPFEMCMNYFKSFGYLRIFNVTKPYEAI